MVRAGEHGPVKIGYSAKPHSRVAALACANPERLVVLRVVDGCCQKERAFHRRFAALRIRNEWYRFDAEMRSFDPGDMPARKVGRRKVSDRAYPSDVMDLWPSLPEFAGDVGVDLSLVRVWRHRKSIPAEYWSRIETKAADREIKGATASDLAKLVQRDLAPSPDLPQPASAA